MKSEQQTPCIKWFEALNADDVSSVGGKNASLGEMIRALKEEEIRVPDGFATTADVYWLFISENNLDKEIRSRIEALENGTATLDQTGRQIRRLFRKAECPERLSGEITRAYETLCEKYGITDVDVAVRSSATAEDLPDASFAGQQETFLNISGEAELLDACRKCYASLFTDRAISYRQEKGFDHMKVALSIGVQKMVRSDKAGAGVMFSIDPETGFPRMIVINAAWGLGENVVQGTITPDEYRVFKPLLHKDNFVPIVEKQLGSKEKKIIYATGGTHTIKNVNAPKAEQKSFVLTDQEILQLACWGLAIENHYEKPMDIEWAKDGPGGGLYIVQARPETVQSQKEADAIKRYRLKEAGPEPLLTGLSIGEAIAAAPVCRIKSADEIDRFKEGSILVTEMTDPDWVPIMKKAAGIITDSGGRTCHAAIVSRELGIPAVVGVGNGTDILTDDREITLSCAQGEKGFIYEGIRDYETENIDLKHIPETRTRIMMNIASPDAALRWWRLPADGIGLARMEFIINNIIKIHPMALQRFDDLEDEQVKAQIGELTKGYEDKREYFIDILARGIAKIAACQHPEPVILRMSDFKTNEYADLIGGESFEPAESNPMIGFRGASRYYSDAYREGFQLECLAVKRARETIGMENLVVMIPFVRRVQEAERLLDVLSENGLVRGENGLDVYMMAEVPSNVVLADEFARYFDGFSIGSNDLTQLALGVDRDSGELADLFDERDETVLRMIKQLIQTAHQQSRKVGICGQAPSDHKDFAAFLVDEGIDSISLNPDSIIEVKKEVARAEQSSG